MTEQQGTLILPELGDGQRVTGDIVSLVDVGTCLEVGETYMEVETDKVVVEIPAPWAGVVDSLAVSLGTSVCGGDMVGCLTPSAETATEGAESAAAVVEESQAIDAAKVLSEVVAEKTSATTTPAVPKVSSDRRGEIEAKMVAAGPAARKLARTLGVQVGEIEGTGGRGRITKQDVLLYAKQQLNKIGREDRQSAPALSDISKFGPISHQALNGIGKATARNMQLAWTEIPHAWVQEEIDITDLEALRKRIKARHPDNPPLTLTAMLCKVVAIALKQFPRLNSVFDPVEQRLILRQYINVGVAVDTPRGLVVPGIREVDQKSALQIAHELKELSQQAVDGKLTAAAFEGNGFTLSNLGGLGVSGMFPVVNWPEVAILGVASSRERCIFRQGQPVPRLMMPLTLGFDHRVVNGADAARFLGFLKECMEEPGILLISA